MTMDMKKSDLTSGNLFAETGASETRASLQGDLGAASIFFSVVAWAAPLMVVVGLIPSMIGFSGQGIVLCFALTTLILLVFAVGYMTFVRHVDRPGAFYTYVVAGLGKPAGLGSAFIAFFSYLIMLVSTWIAFGVFARQLIHDTFMGPDIPWWILTLAGVFVIGYLSTLAVDLSAKVLTIALALEVGVVTIFDIIVFTNGGPDGVSLAPFKMSGLNEGGLGLGILFAVLCFIGFESSALYREETRQPDITIPRVTFLAVVSIGAFYILAAWATVTALGSAGVISAKTADVTTMFNHLGNQYAGKLFADVTNILMLTSSFACLLSLHNGVTRYAYSLGRDGVFPKCLGKAHPRYFSPYFASTIISFISVIATLVIAGTTNFERTGTQAYNIYIRVNGLGTVGVLMLMCLVSFSIFWFFRKNRAIVAGQIWSTIVAPLLGIAGLISIFILATKNISMLMGASENVSLILVAILPVLFVAGFIYAVWLRKNNEEVFQKIGRQ